MKYQKKNALNSYIVHKNGHEKKNVQLKIFKILKLANQTLIKVSRKDEILEIFLYICRG